MITVTAVPASGLLRGAVRLAPIAAVRAALPPEIPVVGNGDVKTPATSPRMKAETGLRRVMIGSAVRWGNPWNLPHLQAIADGAPDPGPPTSRSDTPSGAVTRAGRAIRVSAHAGARAAQDRGVVLARPARRRSCAKGRSAPERTPPLCSRSVRAFFAG